MPEQNYANHKRMVSGYHYVTFSLVALIIVGSAWSLVGSFGTAGQFESLLLLGIGIGLLMVGYFARAFALKAQDRAIRAEENLRQYVRTGSLLDPALTTRQIIGLRFASDEEFDALAADAVQNAVSEDDIKKSVKNWKPDTYRV